MSIGFLIYYTDYNTLTLSYRLFSDKDKSINWNWKKILEITNRAWC